MKFLSLSATVETILKSLSESTKTYIVSKSGREHTSNGNELREDGLDVVVVLQLRLCVDLVQHLVAVGRVELEADLKFLVFSSKQRRIYRPLFV